MPNSINNTGTGGFPINDDRYTYDVGVPDDQGGAKGKWDAGDVAVDNTVKDLPGPTRKTLAQYLSDTTLGKTPSASSTVPNKYPVSAPGNVPTTVPLKDAKGYPVTPSDVPQDQQHFSNIPTGRSTASDNLNILRGLQEPSPARSVDGNGLLRDATDDIKENRNVNPSVQGGVFPPISTTANGISKRSDVISKFYGDTSQVSKSVIFNRFNVDAQFEDYVAGKADPRPGLDKEQPASPGASQKQRQLGQPQFAKKYKMGANSPAEGSTRDVSFGNLAQIGAALSVRASGEFNSTAQGYNPNDNTNVEADILSQGTSQRGFQIDKETLSVEDVLANLTPDSIAESLLIDPMGKSWGSLNNVHDTYSGISSTGMQALSLALLVALGVIMDTMASLFSVPKSSSTRVSHDSAGRKPYGAYESNADSFNYSSASNFVSAVASGNFDFWKFMDISPTEHRLERCIFTGILSFFGGNQVIDSNSQLLNAVNSLPAYGSENPGYNVVIARSVSRSFQYISTSLEGLNKAFSVGLSSGILQLFEMMKTLKDSKFMRSISIFAQIGDRALSNAPSPLDDLLGTFGNGVKHPGILDLSTSIHKGRLSSMTSGINMVSNVSPLTLSWASYRATDLFILPHGLGRAISESKEESSIRTPSLLPSIQTESNGTTEGVKSNGVYYSPGFDESRIPTVVRENLEKALSAEYVPFYIHDVRTNEIVSFHAFLESLSDDYAASYDSFEAFGRVEPVKTYKGTTRTINFSFHAIATNPKDFDSMWLKINKLTTLVYPQFSKGREINAKLSDGKNYVFEAPFSQKIQAAPLVRVRIGDLIRSNYSKFNLAKIFGYTSPDSQFADQQMPATFYESSEQGSYEDFYQTALFTLLSAPGSSFRTRYPLPKALPEENRGSPKEGLLLPAPYVLRIVGYDTTDPRVAICEVEVAVGYDAPSMSPLEMANIFKIYGVNPLPVGGDVATEKYRIIGRKFKIPKSHLEPTPTTTSFIKKLIAINPLYPKSLDEVALFQQYTANVKEFMKDDVGENNKGNAVAKSFRSSGGAGLAGFIESMQFSWLDKSTWEVNGGDVGLALSGVAPKSCKVTISFSPVHDITPGLDHMGANRAAIYPVGPYYHKGTRT